jgi:predicted Zn-dependent protease
MGERLKPGEDAGFAKTHPAPQDRIAEILRRTGGAYTPVKTPSARQARFMKAVGKI